jgi:alpha-acetolactate decarboxylase
VPELNLVIPAVLDRALKDEMTRTGTSASSVVAAALAEYFHTPLHTLFQVSTSGALVEGEYTGAISPEVILKHGNFGLGTFESLDGLWSPGFSSAFSIAGYHFHFMSEDRAHGGHLLACSTGPLQLRIEALTDFHLALPENESFLTSSPA